MKTAAPAFSPWIKNPTTDLFFFSFGWLLIVAAYLVVDRTANAASLRVWVLNFVLLIAVFHRHLTFPLVYADPQQLNQRKKAYLVLPFIFGALTVAAYLVFLPPALTTQKISFPLPPGAPPSMVFRVVDSQGVKRIPVTLSGLETSLQDLATTFQKDLGDTFQVQAKEDRLKLTLNTDSKDSRFSVLRSKGDPQTFEALGLKNGSIKTFAASRPLLMALVFLSALWNFYHTLMQKMGILRIYSRKADYGKAWLDKGMVWGWFAFLFFQLGSMPEVVNKVAKLAMSGRYLTEGLKPFFGIFSVLALLSFAVALVLTFLYLQEEWKNRNRTHWPKNIFLVSILALYGLFFYDFLVAYVAFGFAHAIEYLAFVNIFSRRKFLPRPANSSLMARWVHRQYLAMGVFVVASAAIFIPWYFLAGVTLNAFILGTSFMHFLYDGWIWKVRNPEVGKPLGIEYQTPPSEPSVRAPAPQAQPA